MRYLIPPPFTKPLILSLLLLLTACGKEAAPGIISGFITAAPAGNALTAAHEPAGLLLEPDHAGWQPDETDLGFVPGEVIVRFRPSVQAQAAATLQAAGFRLQSVRPLAAASTQLFVAAAADRQETLELIRMLNAREDVLYAQPNYLLYPLLAPDDLHYTLQWHYPAVSLPQAWDLTTGSAATVVAVLDTGILHADGDASRTHPDFSGKVLPGYDFISNPVSAHDGDGRDPDPFDEPPHGNPFHGSHVAGTVAAATNNAEGVAGVDWQARILPVRVLGTTGGTELDVAEGLLWAAGFHVPGIPDNPHPADVINLSLGGEGRCSPFLQDAISRAAERSIIVVAAGNESIYAHDFTPANCSSVITVGATDHTGARAPYSNHGSRLDIMAPGGSAEPAQSGVLSTAAMMVNNQLTFGYGYQYGTSMAAPHVAGIASLLKALDPDLDWRQVLAVLRASATPLPGSACGGTPGSEAGSAVPGGDCSAGLVNAFEALRRVHAGDVPPALEPAPLAFEPALLDFGSGSDTGSDQLTYRISNSGSASVDWQLHHFSEEPGNPGHIPAGALQVPAGMASGGSLAPGEGVSTGLRIQRDLLSAGTYRLGLTFELGNGERQALDVRFSIPAASTPVLNGPLTVTAWLEGADGRLVPSGSRQSRNAPGSFRFEARPGANRVEAWSDENGNGVMDAGDWYGQHPGVVPVESGSETAGIVIRMEPVR